MEKKASSKKPATRRPTARAARPAKKVPVAKGVKETRKKVSAARKKPGGSNVGEYKKVSKKEFCGPAGGAPKGSYPVNSAKRCRSALSLAHNAPNPSGIKSCVKRKCKGILKKLSRKKK